MPKNNVVMFAASQGGHYKELMGLRELFLKYQSVLVTDNLGAAKQTEIISKFTSVAYSHAMDDWRKENAGTTKNSRWSGLKAYYKLFRECIGIYNKFKPAVIISTGANIAVPLFVWGKLHGSKLIFIESNAKVYSKTTTGTLIGWLSDKVIVQWPEMLNVYPKAEYHGVIHS